jgi:type III pantothenate kinase
VYDDRVDRGGDQVDCRKQKEATENYLFHKRNGPSKLNLCTFALHYFSMNLIIDLGNTLTKIALFEGGDLVKLGSYKRLTVDQVTKFFQRKPIRAAMVSNVAHPTPLIRSLRAHFPVLLMDPDLSLPIRNRYGTPETLGNDRLACAVAAAALFPGKPVLSIDTGTCIKFDLVDAAGNYWGGAISPGLQMRLKAMHTFTARLPLVKLSITKNLVGNSTHESILNGAVNGALHEVTEAIRCFRAQYPGLKVILTGGDRVYFEERLKNRIFAVPNLVLQGLNLILEHNVKDQ